MKTKFSLGDQAKHASGMSGTVIGLQRKKGEAVVKVMLHMDENEHHQGHPERWFDEADLVLATSPAPVDA